MLIYHEAAITFKWLTNKHFFFFFFFFFFLTGDTICSARNGKGDCSDVCLPTKTKAVCECEYLVKLQSNNVTCIGGMEHISLL